jgi:Ca-activated chloride channel family protein
MHRSTSRGLVVSALSMAILVAACNSGGAATATPAAPTTAPGTGAPTTAPATTGPSATSPSTGAPGIDAPASVQAGVQFDVTWTGPNAEKDYVTIVKAGATRWTNEPYFYTTAGSPAKLTAPSADGRYELWYVSGKDDSILARRPITVTPFQGDLLAADSVMAGSQFDVAWNGPNGPGDYVTVVKSGATAWTNESYFYTRDGSPGKLTAGIEPGAYELWYVIGSDSSVKSRRPITVTPYVVTLSAPREVAKGAQFQVTWTGPDGPSDYITIVPAGSPPNTYLSYAYTSAGNPATITAPTDPGNYEIWYASDRVKDIVFGRITIKVN